MPVGLSAKGSALLPGVLALWSRPRVRADTASTYNFT